MKIVIKIFQLPGFRKFEEKDPFLYTRDIAEAYDYVIAEKLVDSNEHFAVIRENIMPIYKNIIYPLYLVATNNAIDNYVNPEASANATKYELDHYELHYLRIVCVGLNTLLVRSNYFQIFF